MGRSTRRHPTAAGPVPGGLARWAVRVEFILGAKSSHVPGSPGAVSWALPETPRLPGPLLPSPAEVSAVPPGGRRCVSLCPPSPRPHGTCALSLIVRGSAEGFGLCCGNAKHQSPEAGRGQKGKRIVPSRPASFMQSTNVAPNPSRKSFPAAVLGKLTVKFD